MAIQSQRPLDLNDSYPCPVCRHGKIQALVLVDAFACDFCHHVLAVDMQRQQVQLVDSTQAIAWTWQGKAWRIQNGGEHRSLSAMVLVIAGVLTVVPAAIVWLAGMVFPPLSPTSWITFPMMWAFLTFLTHLGLVLWLVGEHYQIPFYIATKFRLLRLRSFNRV